MITGTKEKRFSLGRANVDMTEGSIVKSIIIFALPLLLGNLFQQLYNMVDTWVIGQTGNTEAYAAVGSVAPIINVLIGFFSGLASGAGVIISQNYGAGREEEVRCAAHTAMTMTLILCVVFTALGLLTTPLMLRLMLHADGGGDGVYPHAYTYLMIYFAGISGLMIYNMGAGIMRAVGDSARPFYYLVVSAVTNTLLDLLFVFKFNMGVAGVAYATVIAQAASAVLTVISLLRSRGAIRIEIKRLRINRGMLGSIIRLGIPAAIQLAITAFSNVFVQSYISNVSSDKTAALAGWTTYSKIDQFIFLPIQSIALAATTFVGQNLGKGDIKRAKRGTYVAYLMSTVGSLMIMAPIMIFAPGIAAIFNSDPDVVEHATMLLHFITPFYLCSSVNQVFAAALRGAGNTRAPMVIMLTSFVVVRQIYLFVMSNFISNDFFPIAFGYPVGWMTCCALTLIYYKVVGFRKINVYTDGGAAETKKNA